MDVGGKDMTSDSAFRRRVGWRTVGAGAGLTVALLLAVADTAAAQWFRQNPLPSGGTQWGVSAAGDSAISVGGGDLLRTSDGGKTWIKHEPGWGVIHPDLTNFGRPGLQGVSLVGTETAVVVGYSYYFCIGGGCPPPPTPSIYYTFIARTENGGDTWMPQVSGLDMPGIALSGVDFLNADTGLAVGLDEDMLSPVVLRTADGGDSWDRAALTDGPSVGYVRSVAFADANASAAVGLELDVDGSSIGLILQTTDGGVTWQRPQVEPGVGPLNHITFMSPTAGIAVGNDGVILTTGDGGASWESRDSGTDRFLEGVTCIDALTCLVVGGGPGDTTGNAAGRIVLRTTDGGATWGIELIEDGTASLSRVAFHDPFTVSAVGTPRTDGATEVMRSVDGGVTWSTRSYSATGGLIRSVSFPEVNTGIAVGEGGTILGTRDGGNTWIPQDSGTDASLLDVSFVDADNGVAVGQVGASQGTVGVVLRTTDGGESWTTIDPGAATALQSVSCTTATHCAAVGFVETTESPGFEGSVLRTDDGGDTWTTQLSETGFAAQGVSCVDEHRCHVVGGERPDGSEQWRPISFLTEDGGESWTRVEIDDVGWVNNVLFSDSDTGTAVGADPDITGGPAIWRTTDGGLTWIRQEVPSTVRGRLWDVAFANEQIGTAVGRDSTILRTSDGGETWSQEMGEDISAEWFGVDLPDADTGTVVGAFGMIMRTEGGPTFPLRLQPLNAATCLPDNGTVEVSIDVGVSSVGGYAGTVELSASGEPVGVSSAFDPGLVDAPGGSAWTLALDTGVPVGRHVLTLTADDGATQQIANFRLSVVDPGSSPGLVLPIDGATDVAVRPTFTWQPIPGVDAYRIQVATDGTFDEPVIDAEVTGASFTPPDELDTDTQYFWRVQGIVEGTHGCSLAWSTVSSFTTAPRPIAEVTPEGLGFEVPVGSGDSANVSVANAGTGNLVWELSTAQPAAVPGTYPAGAGPAPARTAGQPHAASGDDGAALDLASVLGEPLPGLRPSPPAAGLVDCGGEPGLIVHDDGTVETGYIANPEVVDQVAFVDRFTPNAYPATLTSVCVAFISTGPTGLDFEIVVYDDDGPQGGAGTELGALPASVEGIPVVPPSSEAAAWFSIDISALGASISSGSAYIGVRWVPSDPGVFLAADESPEHPVGFAGGYWWHDVGNVWAPTESAFANYRSLFVRAKSIPGGCHDPATIQWLSVSPNAGITPAGSTTPVQVTVDAAGLEVGQHTANLCIASNDPENPMVAVPISLTVVGAELTLDQQGLDFGDVFVNDTSDPQIVTLQNTGSLDATGLGFLVTGAGFEVDAGACGTTLGVGESCQVSVTFAPPESGPAEGTLEVTSETGLPVILALSGDGVRETEVFTPMGLEVDTEPIVSDANGVFEPGELAPVAPVWRHDGVAPQDVSGTASDLTGPEGPTYTLLMADADYGLVEPGTLAGCQESDSCYEMDIGPAGVARPVLHWDATFDETLSDDTSHTWTLHVGDSFADVPRESPFYRPVEALLHSGVTEGCTDTEYCPGGFSNRAQMPVFVLRALEGPGYQPAACSVGAPTFADVPIDSPFCPWIKELTERGVVSGCDGDSYCPSAPVTRAQMAIFLLRTLEGAEYTPPDCTGEFTDVTCPSPFAAWVEELARRGVTSGCSETEFCPSAPVTRAQMATFIARTFGLELYGP